jgi:hypothetical protein
MAINPHKNSNNNFYRNRKKILKFLCKYKRPQIANVIMSKKSNVGGIPIADFQLKTHRKKTPE